jgi:hypothetical protein
MTIHFNANLRPLVGERVGMLHWIMDPLAAGFIIAYDLSGNAVLISNFDVGGYPGGLVNCHGLTENTGRQIPSLHLERGPLQKSSLQRHRARREV